MTRDELIDDIALAQIARILGQAEAMDMRSRRSSGWKATRLDAEAAMTVLAPLLKRVAEGLEPFGEVSAKAKGSDDACWCGQDGAVIRYHHLRTASSLHAELKGLLS